jgi:hypothetical protein
MLQGFDVAGFSVQIRFPIARSKEWPIIRGLNYPNGGGTNQFR